MSFRPAKYPLNTADAVTNTIAGANTFITYWVSGTLNIAVAIFSAPKNNMAESTRPIPVKNILDILLNNIQVLYLQNLQNL